MWVKLKNLDTSQGENVNLLTVARCLKGKEGKAKLEFPNGKSYRYSISYADMETLYNDLWNDLINKGKDK